MLPLVTAMAAFAPAPIAMPTVSGGARPFEPAQLTRPA
jgi:hypothetical protein